MTQNTIPVVDLSMFTLGNEINRQKFVQELGDAFHNIGFVGVKNHSIPEELIQGFFSASRSFFDLPKDVKKGYEIEGLAGQRGYTSFGKEHAKGYDAPDLKEFYQFGQEPESNESDNIKNITVSQVPEFTEEGKRLFGQFERVGIYLMRAIAIHLGLDEYHFDGLIYQGSSILRTIHYPPITEEPKNSIRAEQHEDINLITLLVGASAKGLQLLNKNNEWKDILPEKNEIVINVGDMLQRLTNNYLKSTTHRVVNPPKELWHQPRISIPFFLHPKPYMKLNCLPSCVSTDNPLHYEPITAGEYLDERLIEIGLKKADK